MRIITTLVLVFGLLAVSAQAQTTEFNYQGNLKDGANPANGNYDLEFRLFDTDTGGSAIGTLQRLNKPVANGGFSVQLDFGPQFPGAVRYLEIGVRPAGGASFATLSPRQQISNTPYSVRSLIAANAATATDALQLGGVQANQYVLTSDARLSDPRNPLPNSANYIQNSAVQQSSSSFNISGSGTVGGSLRVTGSGASSNTAIGSFSSAGRFDIDAPNLPGGRFAVLNSGNVGINTPFPVERLHVTGNGLFTNNLTVNGSVGIGTAINANAPLAFPPALGKKITLYPGSVGDAGFAVFGNELRIASDYSGADITFGYDDRTNGFQERMRVRASGALRLAGSDGQAGQVITSNGAGAAAQWKSSTNTLYQSTTMATDTGPITPGNTFTLIPGLSQTINVAGNAKLLVQFGVYAYAISCFACGPSYAYIDVTLDGNMANRVTQDIPNASTSHFSGSWLLTVGAGNHTVELKAQSIGPSVGFGCTGCTLKSSLIIQTIPE